MNETPKPDWTIWKHIPRLNADEATALTLNLDPAKLRPGIGDVFDLDDDLSNLSEWAAEIPADLISTLEHRLFMFRRIHGALTMITPEELVTFAKRLNWSIPDELDNLAAPATADAEPKPAADTISDNERTKLLKHIGALALALSEKSSLYKRGGKPNVFQIANGVGDMLNELPNGNSSKAGNASLRASISEGVALLVK